MVSLSLEFQLLLRLQSLVSTRIQEWTLQDIQPFFHGEPLTAKITASAAELVSRLGCVLPSSGHSSKLPSSYHPISTLPKRHQSGRMHGAQGSDHDFNS
ncbi:MAG: hypothetical protein ACK587_05935 [Cyanobacteriota bacterium]